MAFPGPETLVQGKPLNLGAVLGGCLGSHSQVYTGEGTLVVVTCVELGPVYRVFMLPLR